VPFYAYRNAASTHFEVPMTTRYARLLTAVAFGLMFVWQSSPAAAAPIVITSVTLSNTNAGFGGGVGSPINFSATNVGWSFPVTLLPGQDLVLTQNFQGTANECASPNPANNPNCSFNFDTSDVTADLTGAMPTPGPSMPYTLTIIANGIPTMFTDVLRVLDVMGDGSVATNLNEAQDYGAALVGPGYLVYLGYADNTHSDACGSRASALGLNGSATCFPSVFNGLPGTSSTAATYFQGTPGVLPTGLPPVHCGIGGAANCYEAGVIRIVATEQVVPEPGTLALLMTGGAMMFGRKFSRRSRSRG
jgi:hypothetical protein